MTPGAVRTAEGDAAIALTSLVAALRECQCAPFSLVCTAERTSAVAEDRESPKAGNGEKDMANVPVVAGTADELRVEEHGSLDPPTAVWVDTSAVTGGEGAPVADGRNVGENVESEAPTAAEAHTSAVAGKTDRKDEWKRSDLVADDIHDHGEDRLCKDLEGNDTLKMPERRKKRKYGPQRREKRKYGPERKTKTQMLVLRKNEP